MNKTAMVEVLTAQVRVLMVGSRQVTLSVFRQLDEVDFEEVIPFGRVRDRNSDSYRDIIGIHIKDGSLVRAPLQRPVYETSYTRTQYLKNINTLHWLSSTAQKEGKEQQEEYREDLVRWDSQAARFSKLPLIILAGLK